jgi:hypothetical protein
MPIEISERLEFGSDAWVDHARKFLQAKMDAADDRIEKAKFSICEAFTDAPAHLGRPGNIAAWHAIVDGRNLTVGAGEIEGADLTIRGDYHAVLEIGRTVYGTDQVSTKRAMGEVTHRYGGPAATSVNNPRDPEGARAGGSIFAGMHDEMAQRTINNPDLAERLERQGFTRHADELREQGYTIVENAFSHAFSDELRATILDKIDEGGGVLQCGLLLERGRIFEETALFPPVISLSESLLGPRMILGQLLGMKTFSEGFRIGLHSDYGMIPAPYPEQPQLVTAIWAMEDFTVEAGCTWVVPGTQKFKRQPTPDDDLSSAVPLVMPKGSIALWDGAVWHWQGERTLPGPRVTLHSTYMRGALRPYDDYLKISPEILDRNPPELATLTGQDDAFGKNDYAGQRRAQPGGYADLQQRAALEAGV